MKRITKRDEFGNADINNVDMSFMLGLKFDDMVLLTKAFNRLADYEDNDKKGEWIPCSKRLPKEEGYYLVTRKNPKGHVTRVRFNPKQLERGTYNSPWGNGDCDILAWMPLPEPYRGDDHER